MLVTWYFFLLLVSCSVGSYYDGERESCVLCPNGTYQDEEGQITCDSCPSSQNPGNQKLAGAHSVSQCGGKAQKQIIQCFCPFFLLLLELSCTVPEKMPHVQCLSGVQGELLVLIYLMRISQKLQILQNNPEIFRSLPFYSTGRFSVLQHELSRQVRCRW